MSSVELDPVLARLDYELMEMLQVLQDFDCSFDKLAQRFNRDSRTVSRTLRDFDRVFKQTHGKHILEREVGRRGYRLTETGRVLVEHLRRTSESMKQAIEQATAATRWIPVVCTSNCLDRFWPQLQQAVAESASFEIVHESRRSADIKLWKRSDHHQAQVGLLSALMEAKQRPMVGQVTDWNDRTEVLPLIVEPIQMLTTEDLGLKEPVDVREAIKAGVTFMSPGGGVAWDFLYRNFPDWHKLRPFQYVHVTDLNFGLKSLALKASRRRAAMVVHGFRPEEHPELPGQKNFRLLEFAQPDGYQMVAVTGVYYVKPERSEEPQDGNPQTQVWEIAKKLWTERQVAI